MCRQRASVESVPVSNILILFFSPLSSQRVIFSTERSEHAVLEAETLLTRLGDVAVQHQMTTSEQRQRR